MGMYGRRFDANFNPVGNEFAITTNTVGDQFEPQLAVHASGRFIDFNGDGDPSDGVLFTQNPADSDGTVTTAFYYPQLLRLLSSVPLEDRDVDLDDLLKKFACPRIVGYQPLHF